LILRKETRDARTEKRKMIERREKRKEHMRRNKRSLLREK
jgi:hypothetical protein